MDLGSILVILALLVLVAGFLARPILEKRGVSVTEKSRKISELQAMRDQILMVLQELDMDHAMGKVPKEDYEAERPGLVAHGAEILRALDELGCLVSELVISKDQGEEALDAMIEEEILHRRKSSNEPSGEFCAQCGNQMQAGDRFCVSCGAKVEVVEKKA